MFFQRGLRVGLALVLVSGLASLSLTVVSTARAESAQETAIGPDALEALPWLSWPCPTLLKIGRAHNRGGEIPELPPGEDAVGVE
jgi:hypothetical protein